MAVPGMPGMMYQTNGLEHDETGSPSAMFVVHEKMNAKRYGKLRAIGDRFKLYRRFGDEKPELGILCWGSSAGPVREAMDALRERGQRVAAFVPQMLRTSAAARQAFVDSRDGSRHRASHPLIPSVSRFATICRAQAESALRIGRKKLSF